MSRSINILIGEGIQESDKELFFGPIQSEDEFLVFKQDVQWPEIMVTASLFKSRGDARKNGWDKPVNEGFTFPFTFGKLKHTIAVLKITKDYHE